MLFLADANILLRLAQPDDPDYPIVRGIVEFWNVCTRPVTQNGFGLSIAETDERARILEAELRLLADDERIHSE